MEIPKNTKTIALSSSTIWFGEDGILYSLPNNDAPPTPTIEQIKIDMDKLRSFIGNQKVCFLSESNPNAQPIKKEQRDYIASEIASITKAMAIIAHSPVSRMMANLFFSFKPPTYPVKMFSNEVEAKAWVSQYL